MTASDFYILPREDGRRVLHLGSLGPLPIALDMSKAHHLEPYTDGAISVPGHWWNAQVTDRTGCPIVIRRSPAQIVAANRMFPYGDTGCKVPSQGKRVPYTDMGSSDITIYMPQTGERPDIGLITDNSGYYMLGNDPAPMIDWAQSAGSCPMHFRDEATGRPIDLLKYPFANANDLPGQGNPFLVKGPANTDPRVNIYSQFGGGWTPQQAHYCEMSYVAYMATQDIGFLEDLQFSANFTVLTDAAVTAHRGIATISGEMRGIAWAFRNLFMAHAATQDAEARGVLPASCHTSAYWKTLLDNQLSYYTKFMADPANQVFRLISGPGMFGAWQADFVLMVLAFGVLTGHSDWAPLYLWALKNAIDRTSGKSGFPPGFGVPYYMMGNLPDWKSAFLAGAPPYAAPPTAAEIATLTADPLNGGRAMYLNEAMMTTRAVLVTAQYLHTKGLVDVKAAHPDLDLCFTNADRMCRNYGSMNPRVSIVLDASQAPTTVPPLPPVIPATPTGGIHMGKPISLVAGQSVHIPLTYDDGAGGPSQPPVAITWTATPSGIVTLSNGNISGVDLKAGTTMGPFTLTADDGKGHTDSAPGTVALPLVGAIHVNP